MVQSSPKVSHQEAGKTHKKCECYPKASATAKNEMLQAPAAFSSSTLTSRFLARGLSPHTASVVSSKLSILSSRQLQRLWLETQALHQVGKCEEQHRLPFIERKTTHTKLVVFDLDETLVHSSFDLKDAVHVVKVEQGEVGVRIRPGAVETLKRLSQSFEIAIFTASISSYAEQVVSLLDPSHTLISHCLCRENCSSLGPFLCKDLRLFKSFALRDILIVENSAMGFALQRENGVPVNTWLGEEDEELQVLVEYLEMFREMKDVRPFNSSVFSQLYYH